MYSAKPLQPLHSIGMERATWILTLCGQNSLRSRLVRGAFWSFAGVFILQAFNLIGSVVTARVLGGVRFGEFGMIQSTIGTLSVFAGMGLGLTATKYVAEYKVDSPERAGRIISLGLWSAIVTAGLCTIVLGTFASPLAVRALNAGWLAPELRIASSFLLINTITGVQMGSLAGFEAFKTIAKLNLIRGALSLPLTVVGVVYGGLRGALWALTAGAALGWIVNHIALRRQCSAAGLPLRATCLWSERRVLWRFSLPAFLCGACVAPVSWLANTILVNSPQGYAAMGVFSAATQWRNVFVLIPSIVGQVLVQLSRRGGMVPPGT